MVKISISPTLESIFGKQTEFKGEWQSLGDFFTFFGTDKIGKLVNSDGELFPYVRVAKNGDIVQVIDSESITLEPNDEISLFLAASGG